MIELVDIKVGLQTGDNNRFLRYWFEIPYDNIGFGFESCDASRNSNLKWFPYNKGGDFRKWYGNQEYIVNWENDGYEIRNFRGSNGKLKSRPQNSNFYFKEGLDWSTVTSGKISFRFSGKGFLFDTKGSKCFIKQNQYTEYAFAFLNSNVATNFLSFLAPTLDFSIGSVGKLPLIIKDSLVPQIKIYISNRIMSET